MHEDKQSNVKVPGDQDRAPIVKNANAETMRARQVISSLEAKLSWQDGEKLTSPQGLHPTKLQYYQ